MQARSWVIHSRPRERRAARETPIVHLQPPWCLTQYISWSALRRRGGASPAGGQWQLARVKYSTVATADRICKRRYCAVRAAAAALVSHQVSTACAAERSTIHFPQHRMRYATPPRIQRHRMPQRRTPRGRLPHTAALPARHPCSRRCRRRCAVQCLCSPPWRMTSAWSPRTCPRHRWRL